MNKKYLPAIASLFIIAMIAASVVPAYAQTLLSPRSVPSLVVKTIAEDDEMRKTGIILLGMTTPSFDFDALFNTYNPFEFPAVFVIPGWPESNVATSAKFLAQYKLLISFNGVPVTGTVVCQVIEKDKVNPAKDKQFPAENLKTKVVDLSQDFVCKPRFAKPGVGVLDVYYIGPTTGQYIADYILNVGVSVTIGRNVVYGQDIQDICVLGWPSTLVQFSAGDLTFAFKPVIITKPDGTTHVVYPDALGTVASCEDMALMQRYALGIPISMD